MKLKDENGEIEITFEYYAEDSPTGYYVGLENAHNAVEIGYSFSIKDIGWGVVGDEHFMTWDIATLSKGFEEIQCSKRDEFSHSASFPYNSGLEFYCFNVVRTPLGISFSLRIHDALSEYISMSKLLTNDEFTDIADEFQRATKQFPVR